MGCLSIHRNVAMETDIETPKIELPTFNKPLRSMSLDRK
jgi:hypothetical protein